MLADHRCDIRIVELQRRQVDRNSDMVRPASSLFEGGSKDPFPNLADQSSFFGQRNEIAWRDCAARRMLPANQCLEAGDFFSGCAHDRLIMNGQLASVDRLAKIVFEQLTLGRLAVHRRLIETMLAAPS